MTKSNGTNGAMRLLKENWFLIVMFASIVASWATLTSRVGNNEKNLTQYCANLEKYEDSYHQIKAEISAVNQDLKYLKERADKSEELSIEILKELKR